MYILGAMNNQLPIQIAHSRKKLIKLLIYSIVFVAAGSWFICEPERFASGALRTPIVVRVVGVVSILFFGFCGVVMIKRLIGEKAKGLVISEEGVLDGSSALSYGAIPWKEIISVEVRKVYRQQFIALILRDPESFIERETNVLKRKAMDFNYRTYGSPVQITTNALDIKFDDLLQLLRKEVAARGTLE